MAKKRKKTAGSGKKRSFSDKQKAAQKKIGQVNFEARRVIYEAGKKGAIMPSWSKASQMAVKKVYGR